MRTYTHTPKPGRCAMAPSSGVLCGGGEKGGGVCFVKCDRYVSSGTDGTSVAVHGVSETRYPGS